MSRVFLNVERSATGRIWRDRLDGRGAARALAIAQRHDVPELLARILAGRVVEAEEAVRYLDPTVRELMPDPNMLAGMAAAAARLADAVTRGECVAILGDYDVDGATAAATLARFLRHCGLDPIIHLPDRLFDGYGPNVEAVRALPAARAQLRVPVHCAPTRRRLGIAVACSVRASMRAGASGAPRGASTCCCTATRSRPRGLPPSSNGSTASARRSSWRRWRRPRPKRWRRSGWKRRARSWS